MTADTSPPGGDPAEVGCLIDVLLPVRGEAPWLEETLDGLAAQTIPWRMVLVQHGPDAGHAARVCSRFPGTVVVAVDASVAFPEALNRGIDACAAGFIARIDADDVPEPTRFAEQLDYLSRHPQACLVATSVTVIDELGAPVGKRRLVSDLRLLRVLRWKNPISHPSVLLRAAYLRDVGGYSPAALHCEDYELWLKLAARGQLGVISTPLTRYRTHQGQVTRKNAIPATARKAIADAREAFARNRGDSILMAKLRQMVWSIPQVMRQRARS